MWILLFPRRVPCQPASGPVFLGARWHWSEHTPFPTWTFSPLPAHFREQVKLTPPVMLQNQTSEYECQTAKSFLGRRHHAAQQG